MPARKKPIARGAVPSAPPKSPPRYRVLSGGITGAAGRAYFQGAVVTAEELGGGARIAALLTKGAIEEVAE